MSGKEHERLSEEASGLTEVLAMPQKHRLGTVRGGGESVRYRPGSLHTSQSGGLSKVLAGATELFWSGATCGYDDRSRAQ
jgi:hypothetical protein